MARTSLFLGYICFYKLKYIFLNYIFLIRKFDENSFDFTMEKLVELKIQNYNEQISEVSKKSTMELGLENVPYF